MIYTIFLFLWITLFGSLLIFTNLKLALVVSTIISTLFLVFMFFHKEKNLSISNFEINSSNKDPQIGLFEYNRRIESFLFSLGYSKYFISGNRYLYRPRPYQRIMGGDLEVHFDPLYTEIKGPKGLVQIILQIIEIPYQKGKI